MSEQQSQKRGLRSDAQKTDRARDGYEPIPPSNPVAGAFGDHHRDTPTDEDLALELSRKSQQETDRNQE
jgi:hypothetical protein